jgi:transcriptional regulator with XRE-family HTH domain
MNDPGVWTALGRAIRADRERQGLTREELARRVRERGQQVTARSIGTLEEGPPPKRGAKRPTLEPTVAALGWQPGWTDRILAGEDPAAVVLSGPPVEPAASPRGELLELVPHVYRFSRTAASLGLPAGLRDEFENLVQRILDEVNAALPGRSSFALAAYRPHAAGEGVPTDDAARIADALNSR